MLTTPPHLTTLRPSPSTVSYTVSTASPRQTFPSQFLHYFLLLQRILLGLATLLVLYAKTSNPPSPPLAPLSEHLARFPWVQVGPLAFTSLFLVFRRFHTESLLTLRTLGIQTSTLSSSYLLPSDTRFIPTSQIRDIFIHEAFRGFEVRYYLAVVVEGEGEVVVVFPNLLPGRAIVEEVWRGARECLYEPKG
ncbi:hypothetical protein HO173_002519 [Letharia columbiana]|uniref:Phosphatidylinositol N-acetylglucosaminyltransferase subunit H conserved domain-containing protein n=1 Tax=Letharia columbiana TaxID=112416 RepID=A0A8H6L8B9_9LECA|nr:uncharacterized protein HO173_002519 [Letharia columbiana]KAF6239258.1 hypothetical protein HO173_002519 [Letharia columbiana]